MNRSCVLLSFGLFALIACKTAEVKSDFVETPIAFDPEELPSTKFYKVISRNGLNLRESPTISSKRLLTLPFLHTGEIYREHEKIEEIQKQRGRWLKIRHLNKTGYIFSGFVLLGDSALQVNELYERMLFKLHKWKTTKQDLESQTIVTRIQWADGWEIIEVEKRGDLAKCDYKEKFKNLRFVQNKLRLQTIELMVEHYISDTRLMDRRIMISDGSYCHCCCKFHDTELHLAKPDGIYSIPFYYGRNKANCADHGNPESEARVTPARFFYHIRNPICYEYASDTEVREKQGVIQFADDKTLVIEKSGEYNMYEQLPAHLKSEWDRAILFVK